LPARHTLGAVVVDVHVWVVEEDEHVVPDAIYVRYRVADHFHPPHLLQEGHRLRLPIHKVYPLTPSSAAMVRTDALVFQRSTSMEQVAAATSGNGPLRLLPRPHHQRFQLVLQSSAMSAVSPRSRPRVDGSGEEILLQHFVHAVVVAEDRPGY
jgi:hypothetical protein